MIINVHAYEIELLKQYLHEGNIRAFIAKIQLCKLVNGCSDKGGELMLRQIEPLVAMSLDNLPMNE